MSDLILIFGMRGYGKTTLAKQMLVGKERVVVFDILGEYDGVRINDLEKFCDYMKGVRWAKSFRVSYQPNEEDIQAVFGYVCDIVYEIRNCTFVIEEVGRFVSATSFSKKFDRLLRFSRHKKIDVIGITHRATDVPRLFRGLATKINVFRQHEPNDVGYLEKFLASDVVARIRKFGLGEYIEYNNDGVELKKLKIGKSK